MWLLANVYLESQVGRQFVYRFQQSIFQTLLAIPPYFASKERTNVNERVKALFTLNLPQNSFLKQLLSSPRKHYFKSRPETTATCCNGLSYASIKTMECIHTFSYQAIQVWLHTDFNPRSTFGHYVFNLLSFIMIKFPSLPGSQRARV